ncbi:magnesium transporter, putative [Plasmodium berghei ANKA]|uniref:Magnesium transporter, putative n=1 Tax=Plasmodium berghei (strain Anka) TaxID=5823 RepID=A0A509AH61_PLABA|nr:magnesium transporter, putative [Plasmodium berghei ANKA]VUC54957.1 magnesium transporter, putative [Plasmodium berghei ANKA]|eukprot:XP_034420776.1 magnesium transporter, putative [Plasmodium berghei ANKA]
MNASFIGVIFCFIGSFLGALGDKYVHDSYNIDSNKLYANKKKTMWIIGILLSVIIDPIFTVIALYFTSAAVVAPFSGVHILWNLVITNVSLKIKIKLHQYMGTFFLICGITLIITFSEKNTDILNMKDLINIYLQPIVIIYICSVFLIITILLIICITPLFCNIIHENKKNTNNSSIDINDNLDNHISDMKIYHDKKNISNYNEISENYEKKIDQNISKNLIGNVKNNINDHIEGATCPNNNENDCLYKYTYNSNDLYNNTFEHSSKYLYLIYSSNIPNNKSEQNNKAIHRVYNYKIANRLSRKEEYPLSRSKKLRLNHLLKKRQRKCNSGNTKRYRPQKYKIMLINNKKKKKNIEAKDDKKERHLYHNKCDNSNENIQSKTNLTITQSYIYSMKNYKKNEEIYYEYAHTPFLPFYSSHRSMSDYEKKKKKKKKFCSIYYRICCCTLCGMSGGLVNIFSEHIITIFSYEQFYIFQYSFTYLITILTLFCLSNQLIFLNVSLSKFSVTSVIPLIMSNIVFLSSLTTIVMQINESKMSRCSILFFLLGAFLVIIGILYLQYNINQVLFKYFRRKIK